MLTWDFFKHYLFSRRSGALIRTISRLCVIGIGVGVLALILITSIMNGFNKSIRKKMLAVEPHLVVSHKGQQNEVLYNELTKIPGAVIYSYETQDVILRTTEGQFGGAIAKGLEKGALKDLLERIKELQGPNPDEDWLTVGGLVEEEIKELKAGEVALGSDLASSLNVFEGDKIVVIPPETLLLPPGEAPTYEKVTVKRILTTELPDIDSQLVFYNLGQTMLRFSKSASRESGMEVRVPDPQNHKKYQTKFAAMGATVETWATRNATLFFALKMEKYAMMIFLGLGAFITCFSIVTVVVLLMTQKRRDIGMLMAMGMSPRRTKYIFIRIGLLLSTIGMGGGMALGLLIAYLIDRFPVSILPDIYYDSSIPAHIDPVVVTCVAVGALVIAFVASWVPVAYNVRMSPADAIRGVR